MTYYKIKCPKCGYILETGTNNVDKSGSPVMRCPKCGNICINREREEVARYDFKKPSLIGGILYSLFLGLIGGAVVFGILEALVDNLNYVAIFAIFVVCVGLSVVLYIKRRPAVVEEAYQEWLASEARLKNPEYANLLKSVGYYIPEKYLNPSNDNNEQVEVESNKKEDTVNCSDTARININSSNLETENRFCRKCGARLLPDSTFCSNCGEKI